MYLYNDVERELTHIRRSINMVEQNREYLPHRSPLNNPAYWRTRLHAIRKSAEPYKCLRRQMDELFAQLDKF